MHRRLVQLACCLGPSVGEGRDGTKVGVAAAGEPNDFAADAVLLVGEREGSEAGLLDLFDGCSGEVNTGVANEQLNVGQTEGVVGVVGVFARS